MNRETAVKYIAGYGMCDGCLNGKMKCDPCEHNGCVCTVCNPASMTECGKRRTDTDIPHTGMINGHYHYTDGACDLEPPYSMGGPA